MPNFRRHFVRSTGKCFRETLGSPWIMNRASKDGSEGESNGCIRFPQSYGPFVCRWRMRYDTLKENVP